MNKGQIRIEFDVYESSAELQETNRQLLERARQATAHAYAPYSMFRVGAAAYLATGSIIEGSNQENASFPAGLCAERVMLSTLSSLYPGTRIITMAVSYDQPGIVSSEPIAPCGICRQSIQEYETRFGSAIRLILSGMEGKVVIFESASDLLPFAFSEHSMKA